MDSTVCLQRFDLGKYGIKPFFQVEVAFRLQDERPRLVFNFKDVVTRVAILDVCWKFFDSCRRGLARVHPDISIAQNNACEDLVLSALRFVIVEVVSDELEISLLENISIQVFLLKFSLALPSG